MVSGDQLAARRMMRGTEGPSVEVPAHLSSVVADLLEPAVDQLSKRAAVGQLVDDLNTLVLALRLVELHHRARRPEWDAAVGQEDAESGEERDPLLGLSCATTAGLLGVSPRQVRRLVERGDLAGRLVGRVLVIDPASIEAYRSSAA